MLPEEAAVPPPATSQPATNGQPQFRQSVAVVIGINDYSQGITRLQSAVNDATRLASLLAEEHGYLVQLLVENVTRQRLVTLFTQELPGSLDGNDRLLVYFAGHGVADDGDDGPAGYILPQDAQAEVPATFVAMTELNQWLNGLPCRHLLLVLDCCFAGAFRWSSTRHLSLARRTLYRERYERFIQDPAWQVLTSAAFDQTAADLLSRLGTRPDDGQHSPFALALFDALAGKADFLMAAGQGPPQGDGVITAPELYIFVRDQVDPANSVGSLRQTPGLWPLHRHGKGEYIFLVPGRLPDLPPAPDLTLANNPYRGLEPYDEQHSALFFGRDEMAEEVRGIVEKTPLTVVTGVSGSGKSSLVKAGLLPKLRRPAAQDGERPASAWHILDPVRPGAKPLQALAALFGQAADNFDLPTQVQAWLAAHPGQRLLLVIDQFEELVTLSGDAERDLVVKQLAELLALALDDLRIVLTIRSDFEPQFAGGVLKPAWKAGRFLVTAMTQDELREIIVQPAAARVLYFEPDELVDRIINDVVQMPGALPLLSFTMSELYLRYLMRHADDRALREADYDALGGVAGALRTRADAEYEALTPPQQLTMQRLLLRMVAVEGTEIARRRVSRAELDYAASGENERVNQVIQRLTSARLLVTGQDEGGEAYVEPAHDALIQAWDRLWNWVRAGQESLLLQRRVTPAAMDWERGGREVGLLWDNDPRLRQADAARQAPQSWLNRVEAEFVAASIRRRQLNQRRLLGSLGLAAIIFAALAIIAFLQRNEAIDQGNARATQEAIAIEQRNEALRQAAFSRSRELAVVAQNQLDIDPERAILVALEANIITRTFESEDVLRRAISASPLRAAFGGNGLEIDAFDSGAGRLLLAGGQDGSAVVRLLDMVTLQPVAEFDSEEATYAYDASFSPDQTRVVAAGDDGFVRAWDIASGRLLLRAPGYSAVWSPDGTAIATAGDNLAADVWNVEAGELRVTVGERADGVYEKIHFTPDGQKLLTIFFYVLPESFTTFSMAKVWDLSSGELLAEFEVDDDVSFSPDGAFVVHGSIDNVVIRDAVSFAEVESMPSPSDRHALFTRFSPSGRYLVTGRTESELPIWDVGVASDRLLSLATTLELDEEIRIDFAEFSPDERTLITIGGPEMRLWQVDSGALLATWRHGADDLRSVRFTPDSGKLITISDDRTMRIWSTRLGEEWVMVPGQSAHFSPDSKLVAVEVGDRLQFFDVTTRLPLPVTVALTVALTTVIQDFFFSAGGERIYGYGGPTLTWWSAVDGQQLGTRQVISGTLSQVELSPDEQSIATVTRIENEVEDIFDPARYRDLAHLWSTAGPAQMLADQPEFRDIDNVAFSPDGTLLLVSGTTELSEAGGNQLVRVWDVATGMLRYGLDFGRATRAQFSPTGEVLVTVDVEEIALWQAADGANLARIPAGSTPLSAGVMSFDTSGTRMIVPDGFSTTARMWDFSADHPLFSLIGHSNRIAQLYLAAGGELIVSSSPGDPSVRLWDGANGVLKTLLPLRAADTELSPDGRFLLVRMNGAVSLHVVPIEQLMALGRSRVTRAFTCEEERDLLHNAVECAVETPPPVAN